MALDPEYRRDMDEMAEFFDNWRPHNPSARQPRVPTTQNKADIIERCMQEDGHRIWGMVVYRCTYKSDEDWAEFMRRLHADMTKSLRRANGLDILDSFELTVFEDFALEGASTSTVRERFQQWVATAPEQEQSTGPGDSQRYQYCVMVDEAALESCVRHAVNADSYVIVIQGSWKPYLPDEMEEAGEPLEGCTLQNVGWMRACFQYLMVSRYYYLRGQSVGWRVQYQRPPTIVR